MSLETVSIAERLAELAQEYGSLRAAERALGFNRCYVSRVANGKQREALGPDTLRKLGLAIAYVRAPQEGAPSHQEPASAPRAQEPYVARTAWAFAPPWAR